MTGTLIVGIGWINAIGRSLREGFFMFWETLWPLILGFGLSGAVQSFVSRKAIVDKLGDHRPGSIARASGFGMISSSCSYAASAMAKSIFVKGADFTTACVFMFASTNLVIELGIILIVLIGWQFAVGEIVGGLIMIALLTLLGGFWLRGGKIAAARERLASEMADHGHEPSEDSLFENELLENEPLAKKIRSIGGWADAATYTVADLKMLRKELAVGYIVAGFLATLVPVHVWSTVFLHGHGIWTDIENVTIGPFIAIVSFVCSIGNVPLAAALWKGDIAFGGVMSFIFADLIAFPLLLVYRRYYGHAFAIQMAAIFWIVMSVAGGITQGIFQATGIAPTLRPTQIAADHFSWNYTTYLNIFFLVVLGLIYGAFLNRDRLGAGTNYAIDPVCGMQVEKANAPASTVMDGRRLYFCSDHCLRRISEISSEK